MTIRTEKLSETVGAEVLGVDRNRLLEDEDLPEACMEALDANGILVFRGLHLDAETLVAFSKRLGEIDASPSDEGVTGIMEVTIHPDSPRAEYLRGAFQWHFDGSPFPIPQKASVLSAKAVAEVGGDTEFASTYAAYEDLSEDEKEQVTRLRVVHSPEAHQRGVYPNPSPEQEARWAAGPRREHPLVWRHRSGRRSLVIGVTADHIVGLDPRESRALLDSLLERATRPERVFRHAWSVGDLVIWDNRGVLHRACYYDETSPRRLLRTTLVGDEPIA
jgi:alpha-ketoglutarate-dependent taurine dioxygenase